MANYTTNLKDWGAAGSEYPDGYNYEDNVPPVDVWDNFVQNNTINDIQHLIGLTNERIEADKGIAGGEPGSPEESHLYHDQDNDRLEVWDGGKSAWRGLLYQDGDTMTGTLDMGGNSIVGVEDIVDTNSNTIWDVSADGTIKDWVNNNADVSNADYADNADAVDGKDYADIQSWVNNNADVPNADNADAVNGKSYSDIQSWVNNNADVPNADTADTLNGKTADDLGFVTSTQLSNGTKYSASNRDITNGLWTPIEDWSASPVDIFHSQFGFDGAKLQIRYTFEDSTTFEEEVFGVAGDVNGQFLHGKDISKIEVYHEIGSTQQMTYYIHAL
jgi:hypothetical protein